MTGTLHPYPDFLHNAPKRLILENTAAWWPKPPVAASRVNSIYFWFVFNVQWVLSKKSAHPRLPGIT
jgi:hypothetical protein